MSHSKSDETRELKLKLSLATIFVVIYKSRTFCNVNVIKKKKFRLISISYDNTLRDPCKLKGPKMTLLLNQKIELSNNIFNWLFMSAFILDPRNNNVKERMLRIFLSRETRRILRECKTGKKSLIYTNAHNGCIRRICAVYKFLGGTEDDKSAAFIGSPLSRKS